MSLTIAEAAEQTGLTAHTLRYYERDGLMRTPVRRSGSGHRAYDEDDLAWISLISKLGPPACRSATSSGTPTWSGPAPATRTSGWSSSAPTASGCCGSSTRSVTT